MTIPVELVSLWTFPTGRKHQRAMLTCLIYEGKKILMKDMKIINRQFRSYSKGLRAIASGRGVITLVLVFATDHDLSF